MNRSRDPVTAGPWGEVVGQHAAVTILRSAAQRDAVAHAWLLVGPAGVGQREAVRAFAAELNCERVGGAEVTAACGDCSTCQRIARGAHPAVREFEPEGAFHLVEAVREEWIPTATRTLLEGRRKVLRIVAADRMNEAAQNAFLKVLEEPPPSVVWMLEAEEESALLETVVSRCRRLDLAPWGRSDLAARAAHLGVPDDHRAPTVRASLGSPLRLEELAEPAVAEARVQHLGVLHRLAEEGPGAAVSIANELDGWARSRIAARRARNDEERSRLEDAYGGEWPPGLKTRVDRRLKRLEREERQRALRALLEDLAGYLRDLLVVQARGGDVTDAANRDLDEQLRSDAARIPATVVVDGLQAIADCADALERNGNPELQLERLLLRLAIPLQQVS